MQTGESCFLRGPVGPGLWTLVSATSCVLILESHAPHNPFELLRTFRDSVSAFWVGLFVSPVRLAPCLVSTLLLQATLGSCATFWPVRGHVCFSRLLSDALMRDNCMPTQCRGQLPASTVSGRGVGCAAPAAQLYRHDDSSCGKTDVLPRDF